MATRLQLQVAASKRCDLEATTLEQSIGNAKAFAMGGEDILVEGRRVTVIRIIIATVHPLYL